MRSSRFGRLARGISPKLVRACATECVEGENYITHDPELNKIRRTIIEMILADHPQSCLTCGRNGSCELQTLAAEFGIREIPYARNVKNMPKDDSTGAIVLDPSKCVQCGRCAQVCQQLQNVWALEFIGRGEKTRIAGAGDIVLNETPCIKCGQCSAHCPVGAIYELDETAKLLEAIRNPELTVIAQIAPAVRVAIGEEFDMEPGEVTTGKIYAALRAIGVDTVFDTNFGADLTIMEEGTEFVRRFTENKDLPLITSCCPAWVEYMEKYACDMIPNFSTAKSPQQPLRKPIMRKTQDWIRKKSSRFRLCRVRQKNRKSNAARICFPAAVRTTTWFSQRGNWHGCLSNSESILKISNRKKLTAPSVNTPARRPFSA